MRIDLAVRKVFLSSQESMIEFVEKCPSILTKDILDQIIDIAIIKEGFSFETPTAKLFFTKTVIKLLKRESHFLLSHFIKDQESRIFI